MSGFKEYDDFDALGLAKLVRDGEVSAIELLEEAIGRTEKINPNIHECQGIMADLPRKIAIADNGYHYPLGK